MLETYRMEGKFVGWDIHKTNFQNGEHPLVMIDSGEYGLSLHKWKDVNENGRIVGMYICILKLGDDLKEIHSNYFVRYSCVEGIDCYKIEHGMCEDVVVYKQYGSAWRQVVYKEKQGKWAYKDLSNKDNMIQRILKK